MHRLSLPDFWALFHAPSAECAVQLEAVPVELLVEVPVVLLDAVLEELLDVVLEELQEAEGRLESSV